MTSVQLSRTPSYNGSSMPPSRALSRTRGILIDTMQLVQPRKEAPVPNHLLESKIYAKVAQNSIIQAQPSVIHFGGFELNKPCRMIVNLCNVSGDNQSMHIIPPQTKYFYIHYKKTEKLVPGLALECTVEFTPDEWRYYYDCIRIHTRGEENLIIPIHAYPVMDTSDFPEHISFPPTPVGHSSVKTIPLRLTAPVDFEFKLTVLQPHPAITIDPLAGIIPANDEIDITVTFAPREFSTASGKVQLTLSQFNSKPLICNIHGYSEPGLEKMISLKENAVPELEPVLDPRSISPLDRLRSKRLKARNQKSKSEEAPTNQNNTPRSQEPLAYGGIKVPPMHHLDTPYGVGQVLLQEPGKMKMKDLREAVEKSSKSSGSSMEAPSRQKKEALFLKAVRDDVYDERQNNLRWQRKLGETPMGHKQRLQIVNARDLALQDFKFHRGDPVLASECKRDKPELFFRRTIRDISDVAPLVAKYDLYQNNEWAVRQWRLQRFQQAARKVIIRGRADHKVKALRQLLIDWEKNKYTQRVSVEKDQKIAMEEDELNLAKSLTLAKEKVTSLTFPTYAPPNVKDDMAVDALGQVPFKTTEVIVKKKTPYFPLKVTCQYGLLGYARHDSHAASQAYVPPGLARPLRSGAEDELIVLHAPKPPPRPQSSVQQQEDMREEDLQKSSLNLIEVLEPPAALFGSIEYPPLHIFNPAPGIQTMQQPLAFAESDPDYHLCPLPRYINRSALDPHMATQKSYLDKEEVIRGVMTWKKFPSQGLTSLSNTPTLSSVWIPRWTDSFSSDFLPAHPRISTELSEEDKANILSDDADTSTDADIPALTPEMVNAMFTLVDPVPHVESMSSASKDGVEKDGEKEKSNVGVPPMNREEMFPFGNKMPVSNVAVGANGPVARNQREQELEYYLKKKYNKLGARIKERVDHMDHLSNKLDLVLK